MQHSGYVTHALCSGGKYLSEVCKRVSGQSAIYWISRHTSLDIARQLRTTDLTAEQLADLYGFADVVMAAGCWLAAKSDR